MQGGNGSGGRPTVAPPAPEVFRFRCACRGTPQGGGAWTIERGVTVPSVATATGQSAGSRGVDRALSPE
ncbi:hypothetical protein KPATCC21470_8403 [Kitasatospora purpeofusca]